MTTSTHFTQQSSAPARTNPDVPPPTLGVLFVHGIGEQKRGETLPWAGEPLYQWLQHWLQHGEGDPPPSQSAVTLSTTHLVLEDPDDPDAPPYTRLGFPAPGRGPARDDPHWILAESWWAADFTPPSFGDLVAWGLSIGPFMLQRLFDLPIERLRDEVSQDKPDVGRLLRHGVAVTGIGLVLLLAQILFPLLVVGLLVMAVVPPLSGFVKSAQLSLAGWLGDAYLIATSPVRTTAMAGQIQRDIDWLRRKGCQRIAVVAHSGGAPIAYAALSDPRYTLETERLLLITYGSGKRKVDIMRQLLPNRTFIFAISPWLRVLMLAALLVGLPTTFTGLSELTNRMLSGAAVPDDWLTSWWPGPAWLLGAILIFVLLLWRERSFQRQLEQTPMGNSVIAPFDDKLPEQVAWYDFVATADLVAEPVGAGASPHGYTWWQPDGVAPLQAGSGTYWKVYSLDSLLGDHGSYWQCVEGFLPAVVGLLRDTEAGPWPPSGQVGWRRTADERDVLVPAAAQRRRRVRTYLYTGLLSMFLVLVLWVGLWPVLYNIGAPLLDLIAGLFSQQLPSTEELAPFWAPVVGMVLVLAGVAVWHQLLLFPVWRWWSRQEVERMYDSSPHRDASAPLQANSPAPKQQQLVNLGVAGARWFAACVFALPLLALLPLIFRAVTVTMNANLWSFNFHLNNLQDFWLWLALALNLISLLWALALLLGILYARRGKAPASVGASEVRGGSAA